MRNLYHKFKRRLVVNFLRAFRPSNSQTIRKPKETELNEQERIILKIFLKVLLDEETNLHYDMVGHECYLKSKKFSLYLFLEHNKVKVINTIYGYDVTICNELYTFLLDKFGKQMTLRRKKFKNEALAKVEHSLDDTLKKLNIEL